MTPSTTLVICTDRSDPLTSPELSQHYQNVVGVGVYGAALGLAVGPGIGPATASMIFFAGIYYGAMYGGSTTSILLNTPGETATMVTAM